jgi:xanthine dehydrogenase YagT iron-sulfur-binding subunit
MSQSYIQEPLSTSTVALAPTQPVTLHINGQDHTLQIAPWTTLLDALREYLDLTGTKKGCDHGQCGACTVLVDGKRINSCLSLAVMHEDSKIQTIEGLGTEQSLSPLQQAFIDHDAFQCGYCTPGQICSAQGLINEGKAKTEAEVRELMSGNICRCGAYTNILSAVMEVLTNEGLLIEDKAWSAGATKQDIAPVEPPKK